MPRTSKLMAWAGLMIVAVPWTSRRLWQSHQNITVYALNKDVANTVQLDLERRTPPNGREQQMLRFLDISIPGHTSATANATLCIHCIALLSGNAGRTQSGQPKRLVVAVSVSVATDRNFN